MNDNYKVEPDDKLFRWLHPSQFIWKESRATSAGFSNDYLSIDITKLTTLDESFIRAKKNGNNAIVSFEAKVAFDKDQKVHHCPVMSCKETGDDICTVDIGCVNYKNDINLEELNSVNSAHGCVVGKKTKSVQRHFANNCTVEIYPPAPPITEIPEKDPTD